MVNAVLPWANQLPYAIIYTLWIFIGLAKGHFWEWFSQYRMNRRNRHTSVDWSLEMGKLLSVHGHRAANRQNIGDKPWKPHREWNKISHLNTPDFEVQFSYLLFLLKKYTNAQIYCSIKILIAISSTISYSVPAEVIEFDKLWQLLV